MRAPTERYCPLISGAKGAPPAPPARSPRWGFGGAAQLSGQCCRSRSATFDRRIAAADHSRETGSIATACLARSSSPLSPTTQSDVCVDFLNRRQMPAVGELPDQQIIIVLIAVGLGVEIVRHPGEPLVADALDIFLHEPVVVAPVDANRTHRSLLGPRRDLMGMQVVQPEQSASFPPPRAR
jgi:hypothetical protein